MKVNVNVDLQNKVPSKSFALDKWMSKRVKARQVIRKYIRKRIQSKGNMSLGIYKPIFVQYGISLEILDI